MKVLHVIPSISEHTGGPGQAIIPMCRALREQDVEVLLATTDHDVEVSSSEFQVPSSESTKGKSPTRNSELGIRHEFKGIPTIFFPVQLGQSFKYSRPFAKWLDEHVSEFDVVHIHAVFNHACVAAARSCRKYGVPYIIRPLGTLDPWSMKQKSLRKKAFWYGCVKKMLNGAAAIHYTAKGEQQAVEESLNLNHGVVVPLGVEMRPEAGSAAAQEFSVDFPTLPEHPYVLVLSRLHPKKALEVLLDAFLSLIKREQFSGWRLILAGEGRDEYVTSLKRMVEEHHASEFVVFPGWLDGEKKEAALKSAQLLALTSYQENFGLCVMESMAYGVPVLISPHVNLASVIEAAGAGWIAAVDREAIETALCHALGSESERKRRGKAGIDVAKAFSWQKVADQLKALYICIVAEG